ncbi:glycosyltransferase family 4 protein [soil metagenome]
MRLLLLTQYFQPEIGAAQTRLDALTRDLVRRGDRVEVVTSLPNYPVGRVFEGFRGRPLRTTSENGVTIHRVWMYAALGIGLRRLVSYASFAATCLIGLVRSRKSDIIVVESPPLFLTIPAILYGKVRRTPVVVNVSDLWPDAAIAVGAIGEGRVAKLMFRLERWSYRHAAAVSTVTEGVRSRLVLDKHLPPQKVVILANAVDTDLFSPAAGDPSTLVRLGLSEVPFIVYAGTMGLAHGIDPLLDAMALLRDTPGIPQLAMIGSGSERQRLERRASDEGLDNIVFLDPIPPHELATLLPFAAAGIVTSAEIPLNEFSRPAKLFPLMSAGIPVLFAGGGEGATAVRESGAGIVVANNAAAIADGIRRINEAGSERDSMGRRGREAVLADWSWGRQIDPWYALITAIVSERE